jgi:hypothetical protein
MGFTLPCVRRETMPEVHRLAQGGAYDPEVIDLLSDILAEVWTEVGRGFETPASVEEGRNIIAKCLLYHAGLGLRDSHALKALVMQLLRHHYPVLVIRSVSFVRTGARGQGDRRAPEAL